MWCNGSTLARNARDVGLSVALGAVFPIFITPMTQLYLYKGVEILFVCLFAVMLYIYVGVRVLKGLIFICICT